MVESKCGLQCSKCEYKEPYNCKGCIGVIQTECPIAMCCEKKGVKYCGDCEEIPCALLIDYSCDPEHGDKSHGLRIRQCLKWKKENENN